MAGKTAKQRLRSFAVAAALLCGSSLLGLALVEVGVRLFAPQPEIAEWFKADARYGFAMKPHARQAYRYLGHGFTMNVETNAQGFRDDEHDFAHPFAGRTVLLLGDSFVFGYGVNRPDRFDTYLRAGFAGKDPPVRVINTGVPGWGTAVEVRYALDHIKVYQPDVVLLLFCGNDPGNDRGRDLPALSDESSRLYYPKLLLRKHSHAYRLLLKQVALFRHRRALKSRRERSPEATLNVQSASVISDEDWQHSLSLIRDFHDKLLGARPNAALIVMATSPEDTAIHERLAGLSNGNSLFYLDLEPALAELSEEERRMPWDGHWSPAVHKIAGELLCDFIEEHHLLD